LNKAEGGPEGGPEGEGPEREGPEGEIGGPDGEQKSEIYNVDYRMDTCSNAGPALIQSKLYQSSLESIYTTYAVASIDTTIFFDFEDMTGVSGETEGEENSFEMSTAAVLVSWGFLGAITGLVAYFVYGFYVQISGHEAFGGGQNKQIIQEARSEQEMACKWIE
jgi:hypothetical protein